MREISFVLEVEPITLNHSHAFGNGFRFKTTKTRKFENDVRDFLSKINDDLLEFKKNFDPIKSSIEASYFFYVPKEFFYTKDGRVSRRSKDLSNIVKVVEDCVFRYLAIDDCLVTKLNVEKIPANKWSIVVQLSIRNSLDYRLNFFDHNSVAN